MAMNDKICRVEKYIIIKHVDFVKDNNASGVEDELLLVNIENNQSLVALQANKYMYKFNNRNS